MQRKEKDNMRVMIVDDEYFACAALEKLVSEYFESKNISYCCVAFEESKEAFKYLEVNSVDLLLTDIKMADIDGLRLAAFAKEKNKCISTVLISGYAEFTYAREAIRYDVADYLLKPISRKQIYECLDKQLEIFMREKEEVSHKECQKKSLLFHQINHETDFTGKKLLEQLGKTSAFTVMFMVMFQVDYILCDSVKNILEVIGSLEKVFVVEAGEGTTVCLVCFLEDKETEKVRDRVIKQCKWCYQDIMREKKNPKIYIAVSSLKEINSSLNELISQCKYILGEKIFCKEQYLYDYNKITCKNNKNFINPSLEYEIQRSFEFKDKVLTKSLINGEIKKIVEKKESALWNMTDFLSRVIFTFNKVIYDYNQKQITKNGESSVSYIQEKSLTNFHTIEEMTEFLNVSIDDIYDNISQEAVNDSTIERLMKYVEENYYLDISLTEIAQRMFYLNPSYLSRLFKAKTGVSFSKYLLTYRLERAAEYLKENNTSSVGEISLLAGFSDVSYFVKQFKREYGKTPGDYQKRYQKKESKKSNE